MVLTGICHLEDWSADDWTSYRTTLVLYAHRPWRGHTDDGLDDACGNLYDWGLHNSSAEPIGSYARDGSDLMGTP